MQHFDQDYVRRALERLESIPDDAAPQWGLMRKNTLIEHLLWAVEHSTGRSRQMPYFGNFFTARIIGPLVVRGWLPVQKNLKLPEALTRQGVTGREPGDLETLRQRLQEYMDLIQADELRPAPHPVFGAIGIDGWDQIHRLHFEHHLKQFNA